MGLTYTKISGVVEYCYVKNMSVVVIAETKTLSCTIIFELKDSAKKLIDSVNGSVQKAYATLPKIPDIMDFVTTEVKAYIKQKKQDYSGYVET